MVVIEVFLDSGTTTHSERSAGRFQKTLGSVQKVSGNIKEEREIFIDNLLVRVHLIIGMSRPALRHGSLNSLFLTALYLPS